MSTTSNESPRASPIREALLHLPLYPSPAAVEIHGVRVRRSSLTGYDVGSELGLGLDEAEAQVLALEAATPKASELRRAAETVLLPYGLRIPTDPAALRRFGVSVHRYLAPDLKRAAQLVDAVIAAECTT